MIDIYSELLQAQIKQHLPDPGSISPEIRQLLAAVDQTYRTCAQEHVSGPAEPAQGQNAERGWLKVNAALFQAMLNDRTELVCRFLADGTLTYVNDAYCQYFGKSRAELVGKKFTVLIPEEDRHILQTIYQSLAPDNPTVHSEHRVLLPDGSIRWHHWTDKAIYDSAGKLVEMLGVGRDITSRKTTECELRESEERYRILFEAAFEGIIVHENGILLEVNQSSLQTLQYEREEVIGTSLEQYVALEHRDEVMQRVNGKADEVYETVLLKKDGTPISVEVIAKSHRYRGKNIRLVAFRDITERKIYEQELQAQRALYHTILDTLPLNVFIKDQQGRHVFVNKQTCATFKLSPESVLGKTDFDFLPADIATQLVEVDRKVWESRQPASGEERVEKQGSFIQLLWGKTIIRSGNSNNPLLLGYSIDITDRAMAEEELRVQEMFFRQILDTGPQLIYVKDTLGNCVMVNQALADLMNTSKEALIRQYNSGTLDCSVLMPSTLDRNVIENNLTIDSEELTTAPNGEKHWFRIIRKPLYPKDQDAHILGVATDITVQKHTLEKLQASEQKYRQLVEYATDMIHGCDPEGYFIYANPLTCHVLGYTENELRSRKYTDFVAPESLAALEAFYLKQLEDRIPDTYYEFKALTRSGRQIWIGQNVHMLMEGEQVTGFQTVARDITGRKRAEAEIIAAKQLAEKSVKAKEQFLSVMSHEIRTPLNAVVGLTHLLLEENPRLDQMEQLNAIKFSADNLMVIINDVLDFSKIESGKITFERIEFELKQIFKRVQQSFAFRAEENNLKLLFSIEPEVPAVLMGDPVRLNQILLNLVGNAIKFTEKGYIEVQARVAANSGAEIRLEIQVKDTGIGIPADKLSYIFESFTQASSETTRKYGGTGLGLAITRRLVELQGGTIQVTSKLGLGSVFTVELPFAAASRRVPGKLPSGQSAAEPGGDCLAGVRVLLVEDNKMNQMVVSRFLRKWRVQFDVVEDGMDTFDRLKEQEYDLILMDLQMPHLDGYTTARLIRSNTSPAIKDIPIIALTASALLDVHKDIEKAGMNDCIIKPFDPHELYRKIFRYAVSGRVPNALLPVPGESAGRYQYVDLNYLEDISANDRSFIAEMIRLFIRQTPGFISRLQEACLTADWLTIRYITHKLKATVAMVGVNELEPVIAQVEQYAVQETHLDIAARLIDKIAAVCAEACHELEEKLELIDE